MMVLFVLLQFLVVAAAFLGGYIVREWRISGFPGSAQDFPVFHEALTLLKENAVFDLPNGKSLEYGMIRGMLTAINEPYTVFVEPPQHELQSDQLQGRFGGIGVRVERDAEGNTNLFPFPDSPAMKAGVQDGDRLLAVGDLKVSPLTPDQEIHAAIRGPVGEKVTITVGSPPDFLPRETVIERAEVALPSTTWNIATDEPLVGIVHIHIIASTTPDEVIKAVDDLQQRGAQRFVIDVRNNGGGLVEAGVNTARLFLKSGAIIEQQYRGQPVKTFTVEEEGPLTDLPMVVLTNRGTASAAEIFAGAMKGQNRALLVGARTYGKDTIQLVFSLSDGSSLHVTAAHWWVPGLEPKIGGTGIQPDVVVDEAASDTLAMQKAIETVMK
jgi:carboxyl-terminal processing protease